MKFKRTEVLIIIGLLLLSLVPCLGGVLRLLQLSGSLSAEFLPTNPRIQEDPIPAILHIAAATMYCVLGIFQFLPSFRRQYPGSHRIMGRILILAGLISAVTGFWMTIAYTFPLRLQGELLYTVRIIVSLAMGVSLILGIRSAMQRDFKEHRAWMIRAYAIAQGAGTQVILMLPWSMMIGEPLGFTRDVLMTLAWLINAIIAERIIQIPQPSKQDDHLRLGSLIRS